MSHPEPPQNPTNKKIKQKPLLRKGSINKSLLNQIKEDYNKLSPFSTSIHTQHLARQVLRGIQVNHELMDYDHDLDQEIADIQRSIAQLDHQYSWLDKLPSVQCQSYEVQDDPSIVLASNQKNLSTVQRLKEIGKNVSSISKGKEAKEISFWNLSLNQSYEDGCSKGHYQTLNT